jgi:hypothetical protein
MGSGWFVMAFAEGRGRGLFGLMLPVSAAYTANALARVAGKSGIWLPSDPRAETKGGRIGLLVLWCFITSFVLIGFITSP